MTVSGTFSDISPISATEGTTPLLEMEKLRLRDVAELDQYHKMSKQQSYTRVQSLISLHCTMQGQSQQQSNWMLNSGVKR